MNPSIMDEKSMFHQQGSWNLVNLHFGTSFGSFALKFGKLGQFLEDTQVGHIDSSVHKCYPHTSQHTGTLQSSHISQHTRHLTIFNLVTIIHTSKVVKITTLKNRKSSKEEAKKNCIKSCRKLAPITKQKPIHYSKSAVEKERG